MLEFGKFRLITFVLSAALILITNPCASISADLSLMERPDTQWYETGIEEQNGFLLKYFKDHFQSSSYNPSQDYYKTNALYLAWLDADKGGKIGSAPAQARERAAATFLRLKRNEIFARNGDKFSDPALQVFFSSLNWYKQTGNFSTDNLSDMELGNIQTIKGLEKKHKNDYEAAFYTQSPIQVKLSDGSALKGNVLLRYFDFDSSYGNIRVVVNDITEIKPGSADKGFTVYLKNGDRITSSSPDAKMPMLTLFGEVDLEIKSASQVTLSK